MSFSQVSKVEMESDKIRLCEDKVESDEFMQKLGFEMPTTQKGVQELMERINKDVKEVSSIRWWVSKQSGTAFSKFLADTPFVG